VGGYGAKLLFIGNEEERYLVENICSVLPYGANVIKAVNIRPDILCALMRRSRLFIGNNSGPLHIAAALGVPGVSTIGPADPVKWSPLGPGQIVLRSDLKCSPCNRGICKGHECMKDISVEMMMDGVSRLLAGQGIAQKEPQ
jgi:ADP-heptose:LPS heptosyltransferase